MDYFNQLAALIYRHWNEHRRDAAELPGAATRALAELPPHQHVRATDVVDWVATTPVLPVQIDPQSQFGDPPVTLYNDGCLVIDIYFWVNSSTSIHQHAFAGAFFVLEGASVETEYDFHIERRYNQCLYSGQLQRRNIRLNKQGDCRPILPGPAFIHSLFHVDFPSVSLVVRTNVASCRPQLDYWWPRLALETDSEATPVQRRRLELLAMLGACRPAELPRFLRTIFEGASPQEVLWGFRRVLPYFRKNVGQLNELMREQRLVHGELIDDAIAAFKAEAQLDGLAAMRQHATSPASRLLLAMLLNARDPRDLLSLIQAHSECADPVEEALRLAAQLLSEAPLSARSPQLNPEDFPVALSVLRQILLETPIGQVPASLSAQQPDVPLPKLQEISELLSASTLFRGLCRRSG